MVTYNIIGGNISGISSALALREKLPNAEINIYDKSVWNKPCGAAITIDFKNELNRLGVNIKAHFSNDFIIGSFRNKINTFLSPFVTCNRLDIQKSLLKLVIKKDISFNLDMVRLYDKDKFSPQTIVASGFSGISNSLLDNDWHDQDKALISRYEGTLPMSYRDEHIIALDDKNFGYGWYFAGDNNMVNIGYGFLKSNSNAQLLKTRYREFLDILVDKYNFMLMPDIRDKIVKESVNWGVPLPIKKKKYNCINKIDDIEFIGVGDAVGMAHPVIAAGIEPAWLSGQILGKCLFTSGNRRGEIDTKLYKKLLWKNQRNVVTIGRDYYIAKIFRSSIIPEFMKNLSTSKIINWHVDYMIKKWDERPLYRPI